MPKAKDPLETNWLHQFDGITRFHYANQRKLYCWYICQYIGNVGA